VTDALAALELRANGLRLPPGRRAD
jgi:hypothetical protein